MIANERQYRITKAQADKFEQALTSLSSPGAQEGQHPLLIKAQIDAVRSQLDELKEELSEYDALKSGQRTVLELGSFDDLPRALIQARIAAGLSQKDLADRLGMKEQQVQRYEATLYASASLERIQEVTRALNVQVREDIFLPSARVSAKELWSKLDDLGLDRDFVLKRLVPRSTASGWRAPSSDVVDENRLVLQTGSAVARVYGFPLSALFDRIPPRLNPAVAGTARFKVRANANERRLGAYAVYAHYLAILLANVVCRDLPRKSIPTDAKAVHKEILDASGAVTFEAAVRYAWSLGVVVLPLNDPSAFHGACWRTGGRNVIVLKQQTNASARWLFDLLHELRHAGEFPEREEFELLELPETDSERLMSDEEVEATRFAWEVALGGRAEPLFMRAMKLAKDNPARLVASVPQVAEREGESVGVLAHYTAFRLSLQGFNWYGHATNLQPQGEEPWRVARDVLLEHADFSSMNEFDRILLMQAMVS